MFQMRNALPFLVTYSNDSRCRRHVAEVEPIENVAPVIAVGALDEIGIELVDPQLPLGLLGAMTGVAVLLKERGHARERNVVRTQGRRQNGREQGGQRKHPS